MISESRHTDSCFSNLAEDATQALNALANSSCMSLEPADGFLGVL